jgi:hypothetical protein
MAGRGLLVPWLYPEIHHLHLGKGLILYSPGQFEQFISAETTVVKTLQRWSGRAQQHGTISEFASYHC